MLINDILWNMENKLVTAVIILDLSVTFDSVDHHLLLDILHNKLRIDGHPPNWYNNYLKPRKFKVSIHGVYPTEKTMQFNEPLGSVQRAFLFIAYTSSLHKVITDLTLNSFAKIIHLGKSLARTKQRMKTIPLQSLRNQCWK